MNTQISTRDIPTEHLKRAYLINTIPARTLPADPRFSYCLYIPEDHYTRALGASQLPLIVNVHGSRRRAEGARTAMKSFADKHKCAVLAPLFPVGIAGDCFDVDNYKTLSYQGTRYDLILLAMIKEAGQIWPGVATETFFLMGYSGGGQFSLRFLYLHPSRLLGVSIGAPGSLTSLKKTKIWPKGIKDIGEIFENEEIKLKEIQKVKYIRVIVGAEDIKSHVSNWKPWLAAQQAGGKSMAMIASSMAGAPTSRLEEANKLHSMLQSYNLESTLTIVPNVAHDADSCTPWVEEFLEPAVEQWWAGRPEPEAPEEFSTTTPPRGPGPRMSKGPNKRAKKGYE